MTEIDLTPITRLEYDIDAILNDHAVAEPITRIELILADIVAGNTTTVEPVTRIETYLAIISGADYPVPEPVTRIETFLAIIAGEDYEEPEAVTRLEGLLAEWVEKGSAIWKTVTGTLIHITDALASPMQKCEVTLEPIQEGSGDPSPDNVRPITGRTGCEVTRTGNNLLPSEAQDVSNWSAGTTQTGGYKFWKCNLPSGTYYVHSPHEVPYNNTLYMRAVVYDATGGYTRVYMYHPTATDENRDVLGVTIPQGGYLQLERYGNEGDAFTDNLWITISENTPYSAYSGTTLSVTFPALGANQWDEEWELGGIAGNTGQPYGATDRIRSINYSLCKPNTSYYGHIGASGVSLIGWFYDSTKAFINGVDFTNKVVTSPQNAAYFKLSTYGGNYTSYLNDISINYPSSVTTYEPYTNTVYGGTVDLVSGVLTVDRLYYEVDGTTNYFTLAGNYANIGPYGVVDGINTNLSTWLCNTFITTATNVGYNVGAKFVYLNKGGWEQIGSTSEELNAYAAIHPIQFVFPLAEPIIYQLTPQEISTLSGENNVWSNGDSVEITYKAQAS